MNQKLLQLLNQVLRSGWYLQGEHIALFEKNYAQYIGTKVLCNMW